MCLSISYIQCRFITKYFNMFNCDVKMSFYKHALIIKGALDKYNIIPQLFPKNVGIFMPLEVLAWVMTAC